MEVPEIWGQQGPYWQTWRHEPIHFVRPAVLPLTVHFRILVQTSIKVSTHVFHFNLYVNMNIEKFKILPDFLPFQDLLTIKHRAFHFLSFQVDLEIINHNM